MAARLTANQMLKLDADLDKLRSRLLKEASALNTRRSNPTGSFMQICKDLGPVEDAIREAVSRISEAQMALQGPTKVLVNRQRPKS